MAVFKEFQISFHVNTDLYKLGMAVDIDPIGFGLLDFDSLFKNAHISNLSRFKHKNTLERYPQAFVKRLDYSGRDGSIR